jgi:hypothetical protein
MSNTQKIIGRQNRAGSSYADLNDDGKRRKLRQAAEIVGLPFDDERGIKVIGF